MKAMLWELRHALAAPLTLFIWLSISLVATITGPFGTYEFMGFGARAIYWPLTVSASVFVGISVRIFSERLMKTENPLLVNGVPVVLTVVFLTPFLWFIILVMSEEGDVNMISLDLLALDVLLISTVVFGLRRLMLGAFGKPLGAVWTRDRREETQPGYVAPRLAMRLAHIADTPIMRLTVRDHLVDVVGTHKTETLRMRFCDAIQEMDPVQGYCTHRSHWVCHDAIKGVLHEPGGKIFLHLHNGDRIPVSRKYRSDLKDAGIL